MSNITQKCGFNKFIQCFYINIFKVVKQKTKTLIKMRIRKTNAIIGVSLAIGALFMIYLVVDTLSVGYEDPEILQVKNLSMIQL